MHQRLSVSAVSSWRWTLEEDLAFWARAGIGRVGLSYRKLAEAGLPEAAWRVRDAGLEVTNLVELGWFDLTAPDTWPAQQARLAAAVDAAVVVDAPCLVLTTGAAGTMEWDDAAGALGEALAPARAAADRAGIELALENTGCLRLDLGFSTTLRDTVDLARRLGATACVEVTSCFAERDLSRTIAAAADVVAHVQVSDATIGSLSTPDRAVPGDGDVPFPRILGALAEAAYPGAFELELVGPRIEEEGYERAVRRSIAVLDALLEVTFPGG